MRHRRQGHVRDGAYRVALPRPTGEWPAWLVAAGLKGQAAQGHTELHAEAVDGAAGNSPGTLRRRSDVR